MLNRLRALFDRRPETAEDWLVRMSRPRVDARDRADFEAWLEADDDHLDQYAAAKAAMAGLEPLRFALEDDLARMRRRLDRERRAPRWNGVLAGGGALAGIAAAVVLALPLLAPAPIWTTHESPRGRITDVALADGSRVTLDTGSAVRVAVDGKVRRVELLRGAAFFDVAHDTARPFQVAVADRKVIVTGTRFETRLTGDGAEVMLAQGGIALARRDAATPGALLGALRMTPGDRAAFRVGDGRVEAIRADVDAATAWRERRLVFRDAPLAEVVAEAGRYADRRLVIADPALARTRVTAVLPLEGDGDLLSRMDALLPISVHSASGGEAIIGRE